MSFEKEKKQTSRMPPAAGGAGEGCFTLQSTQAAASRFAADVFHSLGPAAAAAVRCCTSRADVGDLLVLMLLVLD